MRFPLILLASLVVIGGIVWTFVSRQQSALVKLEGSILKVRTLKVGPDSMLVLADYRITNPTTVPFVVEKVELLVDRPAGNVVAGDIFSGADVDRVFPYAGQKYNEALKVSDRIAPGETIDRMTVARVDLLDVEFAGRVGLRLRIHELDGQITGITEPAKQK